MLLNKSLNLVLVSNFPLVLFCLKLIFESKLPVKLCVLEASPLVCPLSNEAMRWTCVRNLKVPVFVGLVFIILIRNIQDLQNDICCITKKKQSALWFTNDLWDTELIIDSVHFWHLSTHICLTGSPVHDQGGDQFIYWQEPDIVLTYRFSEASVSILMIKAIKFELITCNFQPKRKKK